MPSWQNVHEYGHPREVWSIGVSLSSKNSSSSPVGYGDGIRVEIEDARRRRAADELAVGDVVDAGDAVPVAP